MVNLARAEAPCFRSEGPEVSMVKIKADGQIDVEVMVMAETARAAG
jgi:hypothetical protein